MFGQYHVQIYCKNLAHIYSNKDTHTKHMTKILQIFLRFQCIIIHLYTCVFINVNNTQKSCE